MKEEEIWWILWGVGIAFILQVLYDGLGDVPHISTKFWAGIIIGFLYIIALIISGIIIKKRAPRKP
jgi:hypothetical protein